MFSLLQQNTEVNPAYSRCRAQAVTNAVSGGDVVCLDKTTKCSVYFVFHASFKLSFGSATAKCDVHGTVSAILLPRQVCSNLFHPDFSLPWRFPFCLSPISCTYLSVPSLTPKPSASTRMVPPPTVMVCCVALRQPVAVTHGSRTTTTPGDRGSLRKFPRTCSRSSSKARPGRKGPGR